MSDKAVHGVWRSGGGNNSRHCQCRVMLATNTHLRLRSRANRKASMKAMPEAIPEILTRGWDGQSENGSRSGLT